MKRIRTYIILLLLLVLLSGCGSNNTKDLNSPIKSETPQNNLQPPKTFSGVGDNAKATIVLGQGQDTFEYEFTNNTKKIIFMCMNEFYWFKNPIYDVFPLCIKVYDSKNNIVRFCVVIEDKYYEYVAPGFYNVDTPTATGDYPPMGLGYIGSEIQKEQTIKVNGKLLDTGMGHWDVSIDTKLGDSISTLPSGHYVLEIFFFHTDFPAGEPMTIKDIYDSTVRVELDIP